MPINIFSLISSIMLTRALFVAAEIGIAEHLTKRPMKIEELASISQSHPESLKRLLYFLKLEEVFAEDENGLYHNTPFSLSMCADHPTTIKPFLLHDDETRWNSFGNLGYSIKTGQASFDMLYGARYFDYLKNKSELSIRFDNAMSIISVQEDQLITKAIEFKGVVADIGGGKGQLINAIMEHTSIERGIVFDLPEVVERLEVSNSHQKKIAGSFFEPISIKADTFILKRILHDWNNDQALAILKNITQTMDPDSRLYIIDGILDKAQNKKLLAAIDLALLTLFNGKERSMHDIYLLLESTGLEIIRIVPITDLISAIECKKK